MFLSDAFEMKANFRSGKRIFNVKYVSNYIGYPPKKPKQTHRVCTNPMTQPGQGWGATAPLAPRGDANGPNYSNIKLIIYIGAYFVVFNHGRGIVWPVLKFLDFSSASLAFLLSLPD